MAIRILPVDPIPTDGRVPEAPTTVRTRGPQAETQAEVLMGRPRHERGSHLSLEVARGATICRLAEPRWHIFTAREFERCGSSNSCAPGTEQD